MSDTYLVREKALAARLGVTIKTLREWRRSGEIAALKVGSRYYYTKDAVRDFVARHQSKATVN